jgi:hypothetical protein
MPHPPRSKAQSEAEEFSDVSSDSEDEFKVIEDNWVFPVVGHNAKRSEFIEVSE